MYRTTAVNTAKTAVCTAMDITEFTGLALASLVVTALGMFYTTAATIALHNVLTTGPTVMEALTGIAITGAALALVWIGVRIGAELTTTTLYQRVRS